MEENDRPGIGLMFARPAFLKDNTRSFQGDRLDEQAFTSSGGGISILYLCLYTYIYVYIYIHSQCLNRNLQSKYDRLSALCCIFIITFITDGAQ